MTGSGRELTIIIPAHTTPDRTVLEQLSVNTYPKSSETGSSSMAASYAQDPFYPGRWKAANVYSSIHLSQMLEVAQYQRSYGTDQSMRLSFTRNRKYHQISGPSKNIGEYPEYLIRHDCQVYSRWISGSGSSYSASDTLQDTIRGFLLLNKVKGSSSTFTQLEQYSRGVRTVDIELMAEVTSEIYQQCREQLATRDDVLLKNSDWQLGFVAICCAGVGTNYSENQAVIRLWPLFEDWAPNYADIHYATVPWSLTHSWGTTRYGTLSRTFLVPCPAPTITDYSYNGEQRKRITGFFASGEWGLYSYGPDRSLTATVSSGYVDRSVDLYLLGFGIGWMRSQDIGMGAHAFYPIDPLNFCPFPGQWCDWEISNNTEIMDYTYHKLRISRCVRDSGVLRDAGTTCTVRLHY